MASPIKGGKARLDQIAKQKAGKAEMISQVDTIKAAGSKKPAKKPVKKSK